MKCCAQCGSFVRHWTDTKTGMIHFSCIGCRKEWVEKVEEEIDEQKD